MQNRLWRWALALVAGLAAWGDTDVERVLTGAAAGAVVADLTNNSLLLGGLFGAGAGAVRDDILGR